MEFVIMFGQIEANTKHNAIALSLCLRRVAR